MTPAARIAAAIEVLDSINAGTAPEKALTTWGRAHRFAGSKDRAALRDHVFDALRRRRSCAALGGGSDGRGLMLGLMRAAQADIPALFDGGRHAPAPLTADERAHLAAPVQMSETVALDCPDWLAPELRASLGADFAPVMDALRARAPIFLRVNRARCDLARAQARLLDDGIESRPCALASTALEVTANARRLRAAAAYREGLVELQDAASQAVVEALPLPATGAVLDYCAGGGGKALALAARGADPVLAHDADPARMRDIAARAARAGTPIIPVSPAQIAARAPFGLVVTDVPCSGSGSWRRAPGFKWTLTAQRLQELRRTQAQILDEAAALVGPGGALAYVTCSLLTSENDGQIDGFCARWPGWRCTWRLRFTPLDGGDGFFCAVLTRADGAPRLSPAGPVSR